MIDIYNAKEFIDGSNIINKELLDKYEITTSFLRNHYSASFINSWYECPAKTLINNIKEDDAPALKIGTAVHSLLEEKYSKGIDNEEILNKANKLEIDPFFICDVKEYLRAYFNIDNYEEFSTNPTYLTEEEIICNISPLGVEIPVKIKGFIDRLDLTEKGTYIIDYKTSSREPYEDKYIDQMILYKWIVEEKYGVDVNDVYVALIFKKNPRYIRQNITMKKQSKLIDKIFNVDEEVLLSIKDKKYKKRKGEHCRFCPIKNVCEDDFVMRYNEQNKELDISI